MVLYLGRRRGRGCSVYISVQPTYLKYIIQNHLWNEIETLCIKIYGFKDKWNYCSYIIFDFILKNVSINKSSSFSL